MAELGVVRTLEGKWWGRCRGQRVGSVEVRSWTEVGFVPRIPCQGCGGRAESAELSASGSFHRRAVDGVRVRRLVEMWGTVEAPRRKTPLPDGWVRGGRCEVWPRCLGRWCRQSRRQARHGSAFVVSSHPRAAGMDRRARVWGEQAVGVKSGCGWGGRTMGLQEGAAEGRISDRSRGVGCVPGGVFVGRRRAGAGQGPANPWAWGVGVRGRSRSGAGGGAAAGAGRGGVRARAAGDGSGDRAAADDESDLPRLP